MPPLAMSQACMEPAVIERYLITTTRVAVALFPSLVAVTVTVPRSTPVSMPCSGSIPATAAFETVHRTSRPVRTLPSASRSATPINSELNASSVSSAGAMTIYPIIDCMSLDPPRKHRAGQLRRIDSRARSVTGYCRQATGARQAG